MKLLFSLLVIITCSLPVNSQPFTAKYDHTALAVNDLDRSANFYKEILFLKEIVTPADNPILRWFSLGGDHQLHLILSDDKNVCLDKSVHFSLHVNDFEALLKHLNNKGIEYINWVGDSKEPSLRPDGVHQVYVQDPDGYWIELNDATY